MYALSRSNLISLLVCLLSWLAAASTSGAETVVGTDRGPYKLYTDSVALIIGAHEYSSKSWLRLDKVKPQVDRVAIALQKQGFTTEIIENPDSNTLYSKIRSTLLKITDKNARLVIYYAGHGWSDSDGTGYIVPIDAPGEDDANFRPSLVSLQEIVNWGRTSRAKQIMFVFDSCFSGSVFLVKKNLQPNISKLYLSDIDRLGSQFLTAGSYSESVPDSDDFSDAFIAGINGDADYNKDGIITGSELGPFIRGALIPLGKQTPQYGTDPDFRRKNGDIVFIPPGKETLEIAFASPVEGPRNATLRSLGQPVEALQDFKNVEVRYYQKKADGDRVASVLDNAKIPYAVTRAELSDSLSVNAIACAPDVPVEALKQLLFTLIAGDIPIRKIVSVRNPSEKPRRIEIVSMTKDANGREPLATPPLSRKQVENLKSCPLSLQNG